MAPENQYPYFRGRENMIKFYTDLGRLSEKRISAATKEKDAASTALAAAGRALELKIIELIRLRPEKKELDRRVARLSLAMFLLDRANQLHDAALARDNAALYSLFVSARNRVCEMLESDYYSKSTEAVLAEYLDTEPLLTACSGLCGLPAVPSPEEIVKAYKRRLAGKIAKGK